MTRSRQCFLLVVILLLAGCATGPRGRAADHVIGVLVLSGTEQPIIGAELSLVPIEPLGPNADVADDPESLVATTPTGELGAFIFTSLSSTEAPRPLLRNWLYELHAVAPGFYSASERLHFGGGQLAVTMEIDVIDDTDMQGAQFVGEQPPGRLKDVEGTLIDEVLRRQGRQPPPGF
jgi:hypothetical protein